jgi:hypothetical protein
VTVHDGQQEFTLSRNACPEGQSALAMRALRLKKFDEPVIRHIGICR